MIGGAILSSLPGGGAVLADNEPTVLYRQHATNAVGAPNGLVRRAIAALRRGPAPYMRLLRGFVGTLMARPDLVNEPARAQLDHIAWGLAGGWTRRLWVLRLPGFRRQTWPETLLFRIWFLLK